MKLTWYGHSCFLLETAEGSVVFDPYAPGSVPGLKLPPLRADAVLCSHGHRDHGFAGAVRLSGKEPAFRVTKIDCFHDEKRGALRGVNTIHIVEAEGRRIAHLGDLGHELSTEQLAALGRIDVLLIPVGGYYTIDAKTACRVAEAVENPFSVTLLLRPLDAIAPGALVYRTSKKHGAHASQALTVHMPHEFLLLLKE